MKRILIFALVVISLMFAMTGCKKNPTEEADKRLTEVAGQMKLPVKLNDNMSLVECKYSNKVLTYVNETTEKTLETINIDSLRTKTLEGLRTNLFSQKLVKNIVAANAQIKYVYINNTDSVTFTFTTEELK